MTVRLTPWRVAGALGAVLLVVAVVVSSGVVPIPASSEHWAVTRWFLHFAMRRSVATHSMGTKVPPLDDPALVMKGAGHYESGCRPCHGVLGERPVVPLHMTPHPPDLSERVGDWDPEDLFYVVRHGVKFTGMPAWPSQERDDEVWAVVAFLERLPTITPQEYAALVAGGLPAEAPDGAPEVVADSCARCHGFDGLGRGDGAFPKLAGQKPAYLEASLVAYADDQRNSGIMQPLAAMLSTEQVREVAEWYASRPPMSADPEPALAEAIIRGERIAHDGIPDARVASCADCHGPADHERNPVYPLLAGQYPRYLELQLELFQSRDRGGTPYAEIMRTVTAHALTPDQIRDVSAYYGSLSRPLAAPEPEREPEGDEEAE